MATVDIKPGTTRTRSAPKSAPVDDENIIPEPKPLTGAERKLAETVGEFYIMGGGIIAATGVRAGDEGVSLTGVKLIEMNEPIGEAWVKLARENAKVKKILLKFVEYSAVGVLIGVHMAALSPLLIARGILPEMFNGMDETVPDSPPVDMTQNGNGAGPAII